MPGSLASRRPGLPRRRSPAAPADPGRRQGRADGHPRDPQRQAGRGRDDRAGTGWPDQQPRRGRRGAGWAARRTRPRRGVAAHEAVRPYGRGSQGSGTELIKEAAPSGGTQKPSDGAASNPLPRGSGAALDAWQEPYIGTERKEKPCLAKSQIQLPAGSCSWSFLWPSHSSWRSAERWSGPSSSWSTTTPDAHVRGGDQVPSVWADLPDPRRGGGRREGRPASDVSLYRALVYLLREGVVLRSRS